MLPDQTGARRQHVLEAEQDGEADRYEYGDEDYCYQVRGKYGGSKDEDPDDMVSDTRWVQLKELVHNMGESELSELDRWAGKLQKAAKAARLALRQLQESGE